MYNNLQLHSVLSVNLQFYCILFFPVQIQYIFISQFHPISHQDPTHPRNHLHSSFPATLFYATAKPRIHNHRKPTIPHHIMAPYESTISFTLDTICPWYATHPPCHPIHSLIFYLYLASSTRDGAAAALLSKADLFPCGVMHAAR